MTDKTVESVHDTFDLYSTMWHEINLCVAGEVAVKNAGGDSEILYNPDTGEDSGAPLRWEKFKEQASFYGFTARTLSALSGAVNRKPATLDLSSNLEYLKDNANGSKLGLQQHIAGTVCDTVKSGRAGLLTDMKQMQLEEGHEPTKADNEANKPFIQYYAADSIRNWRDQDGKLSLVVLEETYEEQESKTDDLFFGGEQLVQYRVLYLDETGHYAQRLYKETSEKDGSWHPEEIDINFGSFKFDYIPFDFVGSENNDSSCDKPPIYDIASQNIKHYFNNALDQNITTLTSFLFTLISTPMGAEQIEKEIGAFDFGANRIYVMDEGTTVDTIQATNTNSARELKAEILENAARIGARLIDPNPTGNQTATAANIGNNTDNSAVSQIAVNVDKAYDNQLLNCSRILGITEDSTVETNKDLGFDKMTPDERSQWVNEIMMGVSKDEHYYKALKKDGIINDDVEYDDWKGEGQGDSESISNRSRFGGEDAE